MKQVCFLHLIYSQVSICSKNREKVKLRVMAALKAVPNFLAECGGICGVCALMKQLITFKQNCTEATMSWASLLLWPTVLPGWPSLLWWTAIDRNTEQAVQLWVTCAQDVCYTLGYVHVCAEATEDCWIIIFESRKKEKLQIGEFSAAVYLMHNSEMISQRAVILYSWSRNDSWTHINGFPLWLPLLFNEKNTL